MLCTYHSNSPNKHRHGSIRTRAWRRMRHTSGRANQRAVVLPTYQRERKAGLDDDDGGGGGGRGGAGAVELRSINKPHTTRTDKQQAHER